LEEAAVKEEAPPAAEKSEKVKDLEKSLKDVEVKQAKEAADLNKVRDKLVTMLDPKEVEKDPTKFDAEPKKKPDLSAYKANLAKIEKEEEEKADFIEKRKAE